MAVSLVYIPYFPGHFSERPFLERSDTWWVRRIQVLSLLGQRQNPLGGREISIQQVYPCRNCSLPHQAHPMKKIEIALWVYSFSLPLVFALKRIIKLWKLMSTDDADCALDMELIITNHGNWNEPFKDNLPWGPDELRWSLCKVLWDPCVCTGRSMCKQSSKSGGGGSL